MFAFAEKKPSTAFIPKQAPFFPAAVQRSAPGGSMKGAPPKVWDESLTIVEVFSPEVSPIGLRGFTRGRDKRLLSSVGNATNCSSPAEFHFSFFFSVDAIGAPRP